MDRLRDRVCLVTGSTGIAAASARRLATEGGSVFVVSRSSEHAQGLADALVVGGAQAAWAAADLTVEADVERAVAAAVGGSGGSMACSRWPVGRPAVRNGPIHG
jgi:NAD(P)-dependent dehydrogenase (short-subunit alcohol dehydrogenase family)